MPSTAIGDIYIPDVNDGSKLKVKFASGKFLQSHSMQNIANILKISKPVLISNHKVLGGICIVIFLTIHFD